MFTRIFGSVEKGQQRGRKLGFPTANIRVLAQTPLPAAGVYAAHARLAGQPPWHLAAVHIGPRPTFGETTVSVEAHLLDFVDRDLYGQELELVHLVYLRPIKHFSSPQKLVDAIREDCARVRNILSASPT